MSTLRAKLYKIAEGNEKQVDKFKRAVEINSYDALRWSSNLFEVVSENRVIKETIDTLDCGGEVKTIYEYYTNVIVHNAKSTHRNSRPTVELMDNYTITAYARIRDILKEYM